MPATVGGYRIHQQKRSRNASHFALLDHALVVTIIRSLALTRAALRYPHTCSLRMGVDGDGSSHREAAVVSGPHQTKRAGATLQFVAARALPLAPGRDAAAGPSHLQAGDRLKSFDDAPLNWAEGSGP